MFGQGYKSVYTDFQILWPIKKAESLSVARFVFFLASAEETPRRPRRRFSEESQTKPDTTAS